MFLYTILSPEQIFPPQTPGDLQTIRLPNGYLQGTRAPDGSIQIHQLLSTNLKDYLNPQLSPGHSFHFTSGQKEPFL